LKQTFAEVLINREQKRPSWPLFRASVCTLVLRLKYGQEHGWAKTLCENFVGLANGAILTSISASVIGG
jgi:hypothetical protein